MNESNNNEAAAIPQTVEAPKPEIQTATTPKEKKPKATATKKAKTASKPKAKKAKTVKAAKPQTAAKQTKKFTSSKYSRHPQNPFREGSGYGLAFDILAHHKGGMVRADLTAAYSLASKKPLKKASFDIAVLLSPKSEKPTCDRHTSCREGFGIRKEGSHVELVLP